MNRDPERIEVDYLNAFADLAGAHVLEVGCGDGRLTRRIAPYARYVTAIDPDPVRLAAAIEQQAATPALPVTFIRTDAETLPFASRTFDGVVLAWSL